MQKICIARNTPAGLYFVSEINSLTSHFCRNAEFRRWKVFEKRAMGWNGEIDKMK
jgi:hypothetical protein